MSKFIAGIIFGILFTYFYLARKSRFKVGDIVYLKPTYEKCIIIDKLFNEYWLRDMNGRLINGGFEVNKGLFDKNPPDMQ